MAKTVQIGSRVFTIPDAGDTAGWGEELTEFFEAIEGALQSVQGPNDILLTTAILANNQSTPANIPGLSFNLGVVQGMRIEYTIQRVYNNGNTTDTEYGVCLASYNGTQAILSQEANNDVGVILDVDNSGQVTYTTSNLADHQQTLIRFKATTIDLEN